MIILNLSENRRKNYNIKNMQKIYSHLKEERTVPNYEITEESVHILCPDADTALQWLAALLAQDLPCRPQQGDSGQWLLVIPIRYGKIALAEIQEYESVNQGWPEPATAEDWEGRNDVPAAWERENVFGYALFIPLLLLIWYTLIGPAEFQGVMLQKGAARAELIVAGEWWRIFTALTLHGDFNHVFSNCVALVFFSYFVLRRIGPGAGWLIILIAGGAGNAVTALLIEYSHSAIGASTASFGALGACTSFQVSDYLRGQWKSLFKIRHRAWITVAAGFALLAFLGTSPGSDVTGHFFGFVAGGFVTLLLIPILRHHHYQIVDKTCLAIFFIILISVWLVAS